MELVAAEVDGLQFGATDRDLVGGNARNFSPIAASSATPPWFYDHDQPLLQPYLSTIP
jgi:hypothetical protein